MLNSMANNASKILAFRLRQTLSSPNNAMSKANRMLGFINRNFAFKNKDIILPLYTSLVRPHLEYAVSFWSPHHSKIRRCSVKGYEDDNIPINKSYEERLASLNLFSLEKRRLRGKLNEF